MLINPPLPRCLRLAAWLALTLPCLTQGQTRIQLDGRFEDWAGVAPASGGSSLRITNDEHRLLMSLELDREILIQDGNQLELVVDADGDPATGCRAGGLGAELIWRFGERRGSLCSEEGKIDIRHQALGLMTAPTVSSDRFEVALDRSAAPGDERLFTGDRIAVRFSGEGVRGGPADYQFRDRPLPSVAPLPFEKVDPAALRLLSHNLNGRLLSSRPEVFARVYGAIGADLHLFQEIRRTPPERIEKMLRAWVPALREQRLYSAAAGLDGSRGRDTNVLVSTLPILESRHLGGSGVFQLAFDPSAGSQLLIVILSLPCCTNHAERDDEIDQINAFVRESKAGRGPMPLPDGTPIILMGDANLVGAASQSARLLDGTISNPAVHGPSSAPDWDGTGFRDALPRHLLAPLTFTWNGIERGGFSPGRLDYVIYSDSVLELHNAFVLHTPEMPPEALVQFGLRAGDTPALSHHLPVVADVAY